MKKVTTIILALLLLILTIPSAAFAAAVTLNLSSSTADPGASITASGTADANVLVPIKIVYQGVPFYDEVRSGSNGQYSCTFRVPQLPGATLTVVAGSGSNVASRTLQVNATTVSPGGPTGGGGGAAPAPPSGTVNPGGDNTAYNTVQLALLSAATSQQKSNAQLPAGAATAAPDATTATILTTGDGIQLTFPAGALAGQSAIVQIAVSLGSITAPPRSEVTAVVLNPLKYQRQFGLQGQAEGSVDFRAPVTLTFPVAATDLPAGISASQLAVYWWNPDKADWIRLGGVYNAATATLSVPVYHFSTYAVMADTGAWADRLSGNDRFATANAVAEQGWKSGADTVVLVNAYAFPDALAAGPLAFKYHAPVLLTDPGTLTASTQAEMQKLAPGKIIIAGGYGAVSQGIEDSLKGAYGGSSVQRYGGEDRYATASAIASALGTSGRAVLVNGEDGHYPDALAISSYAAYQGMPILFSSAKALPAVTAETLRKLQVKETLVVGGEGAIPAAVFKQLAGATRYGGEDRYATAAAIASGLSLNADRVYFTTGRDFPDALVAGNLAAQTLSPLLLLDQGVPQAVKDYLTANRTSIDGMTLVGGEGAISAQQNSTLRQLK